MPFRYLVILLFCAKVTSLRASEMTKSYSLLQAMKESRVNICAEGLGGYSGKCLFLNLSNRTNQAISITVDPAMIFRPVDTFQQDLVVMGEEVIVLAPNESKSISLNAFCGKSYAHSPRRNTKFRFLKQGSSAMILMAKYINAHKLYDHVGQAAVWSFTNNKSLSRIYNSLNSKVSLGLIDLIAKNTGKKVPEYYTVNNKSILKSSEPVYDPNISKLYVELNWQYNKYAKQHVYVFRSDGTFYKEINDGERISPKGHFMRIEFDPHKDPLDTYTVYVKDDANFVYQKKTVIVELDSD